MDITGLGSVFDFGSKIIDKLWPDPEKAQAAKLELFKLQQSGELTMITGQMDINKTEAANPSLLVSGWRPFIGWVCGTACAWNWLGISIVSTIMTVAGHPVVLKAADITEMLPILVSLLGLGAYRTYEKINNVAAK